MGARYWLFPKGVGHQGQERLLWNRRVAGVAPGVINEGEIGTSPTLAAASESQALATK